MKSMIESKEHDVNRSGIKEDKLTEQMRDLELVRYALTFFVSHSSDHACVPELKIGGSAICFKQIELNLARKNIS